METKKMSLANMQGKLSRAEMKNVMAGIGENTGCSASDIACTYYEANTGTVTGKCGINSNNKCVCIGPNSSIISAQCSESGGGV